MNSLESRMAFYQKDLDNPFSVNGFKGTWNFSDHRLIPDVLHGFLLRFFSVGRLRRVPLEEINKIMNEVWEGPGSLEKLFLLEKEMELSGKDIKFDPRDFAKSKKTDEDDDDEGYLIMPDLPLNNFADSEDFDEDE